MTLYAFWLGGACAAVLWLWSEWPLRSIGFDFAMRVAPVRVAALMMVAIVVWPLLFVCIGVLVRAGWWDEDEDD